MTAHTPKFRAVDAHFARRTSAATEAALRAHLPTCLRCQRRYDRQLLLSRLDPRAPSAEDRLAAGLGFRSRPRLPLAAFPLAALTVAALALVVGWPRAPEPVSRGAGPAPSLIVYRVGPAGEVAPVGGRVDAGDELAFAYTNPGGRRYLLVWGEDEHGHVYWFHPGWPVGAPPPRAVAALPGPGPHELSEAVRHRFDGRRLRVTALFSDEPLGVGAVERDGRARPALGLETQRAETVSRVLEVRP